MIIKVAPIKISVLSELYHKNSLIATKLVAPVNA
jgi:hypothetical protein